VGTHEVGRCLRGADLVVTAFEGPGDVSVAVPVEERPDPILVIGDEAVQRDHRTHDRLSHPDIPSRDRIEPQEDHQHGP